MNEKRIPLTLHNPNNCAIAAKVIERAYDCFKFEEDWGQLGVKVRYEVNWTRGALMMQGDDSWGAVTGVCNGEHGLLLIGNFGDNGELHMYSDDPQLKLGWLTDFEVG
jgi:hypothetical protein